MNIRLENAHLDEFVFVDLGCIDSDEELVIINIDIGWVIGTFLGRKGHLVATPFPFTMFEI